jgi:hexosaminidase
VQHWLAFDESLESMFDHGRLEEMDLPEGMSIPKEMIPVIIELFRTGRADLGRAMERGAKVILSPAAKLYLDKPYAEAPNDADQAAMQRRVGLRVYPPTTIEQSFDWDPAGALNGGLDAVAGIEGAMWTETISSAEELEFMLLPRLAAIAEKAWAAEPLSEWHEFRSRLAQQSTIWRRRGWNFFTSSLVDWR